MNLERIGKICENCAPYPDTGIVRGPGDLGFECERCKGLGRYVDGINNDTFFDRKCEKQDGCCK